MWAKLNMNENTMTLFDFVESCPLVYFLDNLEGKEEILKMRTIMIKD